MDLVWTTVVALVVVIFNFATCHIKIKPYQYCSTQIACAHCVAGLNWSLLPMATHRFTLVTVCSLPTLGADYVYTLVLAINQDRYTIQQVFTL